MRAAKSVAPLLNYLHKSCFTTTRSLSTTQHADTEVLVIGAGVVGLAIARQLAAVGKEVLLVEAASKIGTETSSRNSEVIHAGIYYPPGSLKAQLCVRGKHLLYKYCRERVISHCQLGKLLVATTEAQIPVLEKLKHNAEQNGVHDLEWIAAAEAKKLEPNVFSSAALLSPSTGIIDSHGYMTALQEDFERFGGTIAFNTKFISGNIGDLGNKSALKYAEMQDAGSGQEIILTAQYIVNAAGLHAQKVASSLQNFPQTAIPPLYLAKGNYFFLQGQAPSRHLIYPVPEPGVAGLGVHLTLDLGGGARFGPDVEWLPNGTSVESIDYSVNSTGSAAFETAVRQYLPSLPAGSLSPGYSGVRPKVTGPGEAAGDFVVAGPRQHGVVGVVSLYGIESPGLTASLALAETVEKELLSDFN